MFVLLSAALAGGIVTAAAFSGLGPIAALALSPFGGSLAAAGAALLLAARRRRALPDVTDDALSLTDEQILALRQVLDQARRPGDQARARSDAA
jgi:hypothetical protein